MKKSKIKSILMILGLIVIDQIIKIIVIKTLGVSGNKVSLIPHIISLNYLENDGAAFAMQTPMIFLIALDFLIVFVLIKLLCSKKYEFDNKCKKGIMLILAGGIGNLIDRLIRGYVIDYFDVTDLFNFPIFNFSDILIIIGVLIIFISILVNTIKIQEKEIERKS